jgi:hypothetical protein
MITACPRCGYSLEGLPDEHACPECGLRYHRQAVAVAQSRSTGWEVTILVSFGLVIILNLIEGRQLFSVLMLGIATIVVAGILWRREKPTNLILVSPYEISLHYADGRIESIPMADVATAKRSFVTGDVIIRKADGSVLRRLHPPFLATASRARRRAEVIRTFKRQLAVL